MALKPTDANGEKEGEVSAPAVFESTANVPSFGSDAAGMDLDQSKPLLLLKKTKMRQTCHKRHSGRDSDLHPLDLVLSNLLVWVLERLK